MKRFPRNRSVAPTLVAILALAGSGPGLATGDSDAGKAKAQSLGCISCHGRDGISTNPTYPNLAGQKHLYLQKQLEAFKHKGRSNPIMLSQAKALSEEDMKDLASYFSSLR